MNVVGAIFGVLIFPIGLMMALYCLLEHIDLMHEQNDKLERLLTQEKD